MASLALAQRLAQLRLQRGKGPGFGVDDLVSIGMTWAEAWVLRRAASPTQQGRLSGRCREVRDVGPPTAPGTGALGGCLPRNEGRLGWGAGGGWSAGQPQGTGWALPAVTRMASTLPSASVCVGGGEGGAGSGGHCGACLTAPRRI